MQTKEEIKECIELYKTSLKQNEINRKYLQKHIKEYKKKLRKL